MSLPKSVVQDTGYFLRRFRASHALTGEQAGFIFGVTASYWSLLERGLRRPDPVLAKKLSDHTGAPLEVVLKLKRPKRVKIAKVS